MRNRIFQSSKNNSLFLIFSVLSIIYSRSEETLRGRAKLLTSVSASIINLLIIMILDKAYQKAALWLTHFEKPRTQTEFENSHAFKLFVLQFVNLYGSVIYIAFFKGKFFSEPGKGGPFNLRSDICDPSGCFVELWIQLAIVMVGEQIVNNLQEYGIPWVNLIVCLKIPWNSYLFFIRKLSNWWTKRSLRQGNPNQHIPAWKRDYMLQDLGRFPLFGEYKEMSEFPSFPLRFILNISFSSHSIWIRDPLCCGLSP